MIPRHAIVAEARSWLGVPFHHQGHTRLGCDCVGLVGAVALGLGAVAPDWWAVEFDPIASGYARQPSNGTMHRLCDRFMRGAVSDMQIGDVLMMRFAREPQHLAILADYVHGGFSVIHAVAGIGVVEHALSQKWAERIVGRYLLPGTDQ